MESDIIKLLEERLQFHQSEAKKCQVALDALTDGNFVPVSTNGSTYDKKANFKQKVFQVISLHGKFLRKNEIVDYISNWEKLRVNQTLVDKVTNALANLSTDEKIRNYKPENLRIKGGYWGALTWFEGDKPKPQYELKE